MGDRAKVLEKKSLFFSRFKGSPGGGPWGGKKEVFLQAEMGKWEMASTLAPTGLELGHFPFSHFCLQKHFFFSTPGAP